MGAGLSLDLWQWLQGYSMLFTKGCRVIVCCLVRGAGL